uniref:GMC_OxRdtase_N domain-containing protein n=1 Tax=Ascaris lumbricoides TaxID=6252 RepID=A0A0M3IL60_ASCLU
MGFRQLSIGVLVLALLLYFLLPFELINSRYVQVKTVRDLQPQYEYIIVGGGAAGILLASRLSSDPNVFVLLLEAGEQMPWFAHSPYFLGGGAAGILLASRLSSDPNVFVLLLEAGEQMPWFAHSPYFRYLFDSNEISYGWNVTLSSYNNEPERWDYWRVLGGSGASGNSFYDIPSTSEWDAWAEDRQLLDVWSSNTIDTATFYWRKSDGRSASVLDYLAPEVQSRFNLHILNGARTTKIAFDMDGMATGVSYIYEGRLHRVLVNREVILSAGVIGSPHLLLLSGIGSDEQLQQFNITPIRSLPAVGEQLAGPLSATIHYDTDQDCSAETNNSFVDWITTTLCQNLNGIRFVNSIYNSISVMAKRISMVYDGSQRNLSVISISGRRMYTAGSITAERSLASNNVDI